MRSVNVPVPGAVSRLAVELSRSLSGYQLRDEHSIVLKRLAPADVHPAALPGRVRSALAGQDPFTARVTGVGLFEAPPMGAGPVVYLSVTGEGISNAHQRLAQAFPLVDGLEGDAYVPHVTIGRGGDLASARRLTDRSVEPIEWTVTHLELRDDSGRSGVIELSE